jgi:hypothetical protein
MSPQAKFYVFLDGFLILRIVFSYIEISWAWRNLLVSMFFFMLFHEGEGKNVVVFFRMGCPQRLHQNDVYGIKNVVL